MVEVESIIQYGKRMKKPRIATNRKGDEEKNHQCSSCYKKFGTKRSMKLHETREHGNIKLIIDGCGKTFKQHMQTHQKKTKKKEEENY